MFAGAPLAGCERLAPARRAVLPSALSILAEQDDGKPLSMLLDLRRNSRDQLDVRIAEGAQVYDGRRVWSLERGTDGLSISDRVTGENVRLGAGATPRLLAVHQRTVWLEARSPDGGTEVRACSMKDGRCGVTPVPDLPLDHPGPGAGFRVALERGELRLYLPQEQETEGVALASGIARLLGVYWVRGGTGEADLVVNRTFRGRAQVHALARTITADGDLVDWPSAAPLVVEARWHLQSGADGWSGPRDGSFSVAAVWSPERVCVAGRVRDDHVGPGDQLTLHIDRVSMILPATPTDAAPDATSEARMSPTWLGATYEACVPSSALRATDRLPFAVLYEDADPGEPTAVITSAPEVDGVPLGELLLLAPD
ncbi:MAG: hypothetical protein Q8P18_04320 [Pseudomonadota bacterium]|nr:hypothetical protein [Pseudomonadota bacterium]